MGKKLDKYIIKNGQKVIKKSYKREKKKLSRQEVKCQKIQSVEPWKRFLIIVFSLILIGLGFWMYYSDINIWICLGLIISGVITMLFGILGRKKTINDMLGGVDAGVSTNILDAIIDGIF